MFYKKNYKDKTDWQKQASWCSKNATRLRNNPPLSESIFMQKLVNAGFLHHRFQQIFRSDELICFADFFVRKPIKLVIEIDGPYHFGSKQQELDRRKDAYYVNHMHIDSVLRMTDQQAIDVSLPELTRLINSIKKGTINILYEI